MLCMGRYVQRYVYMPMNFVLIQHVHLGRLALAVLLQVQPLSQTHPLGQMTTLKDDPGNLPYIIMFKPIHTLVDPLLISVNKRNSMASGRMPLLTPPTLWDKVFLQRHISPYPSFSSIATIFGPPPQTTCLGPWPRGYCDYFFLAGPFSPTGPPQGLRGPRYATAIFTYGQ